MKKLAIVAGFVLLVALAGVVQAQSSVNSTKPISINPGPDDQYSRFIGVDVTVNTLNNGQVLGVMKENFINDFSIIGKCGKLGGKLIYVTKSAIVMMYEGYVCPG